MSSRLITIGCLQMGKARSSGNLHLNHVRPIPALTNPQHGARPRKAFLDYLSTGEQPPTAALQLALCRTTVLLQVLWQRRLSSTSQ